MVILGAKPHVRIWLYLDQVAPAISGPLKIMLPVMTTAQNTRLDSKDGHSGCRCVALPFVPVKWAVCGVHPTIYYQKTGLSTLHGTEEKHHKRKIYPLRDPRLGSILIWKDCVDD